MTKRTVKQKSKGNKRPAEKPVDAEIRRAAERAGIPSSPSTMGAKLADTLIASIEEMPADARYEAVEGIIARLNELAPDEKSECAPPRPTEAEIEARAEIPTMLTPHDEPATQLAFLKDKIVRCTDLVGESIAGLASQTGDYVDVDAVRGNLSDVLVALWRIRWECFAIGGEIGVKKALVEGGAS